MDDLAASLDFWPAQAKRDTILNRILQKTALLENMPELGPVQPDLVAVMPHSNSRYVLAGEYKVIYHIVGEIVYIDQVLATRDNPDRLRLTLGQ